MWIEFTRNDGTICINMNQATDITQSKLSNNTIIVLTSQNGGDARKFEVKEDLQTVMKMIADEQQRLANLTKTAR